MLRAGALFALVCLYARTTVRYPKPRENPAAAAASCRSPDVVLLAMADAGRKVPNYKGRIKKELPSSSVNNKDGKALSYQAPRHERALCTEAGLRMLFRIIAACVVQALEAASLD